MFQASTWAWSPRENWWRYVRHPCWRSTSALDVKRSISLSTSAPHRVRVHYIFNARDGIVTNLSRKVRSDLLRGRLEYPQGSWAVTVTLSHFGQSAHHLKKHQDELRPQTWCEVTENHLANKEKKKKRKKCLTNHSSYRNWRVFLYVFWSKPSRI